MGAEKDLAGLCGGASLAEVGQDGFTHGCQQGQNGGASRLTLPHVEALGAPINIVESEADHFTGPDPVGGQQQEDRIVAQSDRGAILAGMCVFAATWAVFFVRIKPEDVHEPSPAEEAADELVEAGALAR